MSGSRVVNFLEEYYDSLLPVGALCDDCNMVKQSTKETICPYAQDLKGEVIECALCDECEHQRAMNL